MSITVCVKTEIDESCEGKMETDPIYCTCRTAYNNAFMIACDECGEWYHGACIGLNEDVAHKIDKYYCNICRANKPELKTTFLVAEQGKRKPSRRRQKKRIRLNEHATAPHPIRSVCGESETTMPTQNININSITSKSNMNDERMAQILQTDTSKRKAKSIARCNIKRNESSTKRKRSTSKKICERAKNSKEKAAEKADRRQCYGPGCVNPSRKNSKYCSDDCGLKLGTNRILEILPQRLQQQKTIPCAAEEFSKIKLAEIRRKQKHLQRNLEQLDIKIVQLIQLVHKSKHSARDAVVAADYDDENTVLDCKLCGSEVPIRALIKHTESCYKKQERRLILTGTSTRPDDLEWNIFCNHKMGKTYCKQLRVLCAHHYKNCNDDEQCGYPFEMNLAACSGKFCGRTKRDCTLHPNCWEEIFRAEVDMEKLQQLLKMSDLDKEESRLRREMATRGNVMGLILHQTIVH